MWRISLPRRRQTCATVAAAHRLASPSSLPGARIAPTDALLVGGGAPADPAALAAWCHRREDIFHDCVEAASRG
eukprot:scaffold9484_cov124-Isochrysis_galbana.AAC.28